MPLQSLDSEDDYRNTNDEGSTSSNVNVNLVEEGDEAISDAIKRKHVQSTKLQEITKKVCFSSLSIDPFNSVK